MTVLEFALVNIRNFKQGKKFFLKPGLNLFHGENGAGKTTLFDVLTHLLFPSYDYYSAGDSSQAALLFKLRNGEIYRLVRDFSKQTAHLYKLNSSKELALIEKEEKEVQKILNTLLKIDSLPYEKIFPFFFLNRLKLPSSHLRNNARPTAYISPVKSENNLPNEKIQQQLEKLREQAIQADQLAEKESKMLDFKDKAFSNKRILDELKAIETEYSKIIEKEKKFTGFDTIPQNMANILEDFEKNLHEKNNEEQQLSDEISIIEQQLMMDQQNLLQNKFLWGGAALVLITLFIPFFTDLEGIFKQINLLTLLIGLGTILFVLIDDFRRISRKKLWKGKLENKNKNLEILTARFKRENSKYFEILEKTQCADQEALETKLNAYKNLKEEEQSLLLKKDCLFSGKTKESLEEELIESSAKADAIEKEIAQLRPLCPDPYAIQNEIKTLEEKLSSEDSWLDPGLDPVLENQESPPQMINSFFKEDWPYILKINNMKSDQLRRVVQDKISILTKNRVAIQIDENGEIHGDKDFGMLSPGTLDQLFINLFFIRAGLLSEFPIPVLLDDPFITIDPLHQSLLFNDMKELSKTRQIILFSNSPYPIDNANQIKL